MAELAFVEVQRIKEIREKAADLLSMCDSVLSAPDLAPVRGRANLTLPQLRVEGAGTVSAPAPPKGGVKATRGFGYLQILEKYFPAAEYDLDHILPKLEAILEDPTPRIRDIVRRALRRSDRYEQVGDNASLFRRVQ